MAFVDGALTVVEDTERLIPAQLVLLAMGFTGVEKQGPVEQLGLEVDGRGRIVRDGEWATSVPGVFVAGDAGRGQSLIVWAIAEGRSAAAAAVASCGAARRWARNREAARSCRRRCCRRRWRSARSLGPQERRAQPTPPQPEPGAAPRLGPIRPNGASFA